MQFLHLLRDISSALYPFIGTIMGVTGVITWILGFKAKHDKKISEREKLIYQIQVINETLNKHIENDKEIKNIINEIEQEQNKQNITIVELDTKLDMLCKVSKKN